MKFYEATTIIIISIIAIGSVISIGNFLYEKWLINQSIENLSENYSDDEKLNPKDPEFSLIPNKKHTKRRNRPHVR